ncbi:MAG: CoB--CoM heterodisulfide reductase iron-sulfur subunit B family protein [Solirubrobacteraceae bacterium]
MNYAYYPGCSLKDSSNAYEESLLAVFETLGVSLDELDDWNCCGATAYAAVDQMKAFAMAARNLALAERTASGTAPVDLVAPCAGCYMTLLKTQRYLKKHQSVADGIEGALEAAGLRYSGQVRVRHPLDLLVNDIGLERVAEAVTRPLDGLKVACYYGCLLVRPYATFDDQHNPMSMDRLMQALGAEPIDWPMKTRCCGGSCCGGPLVGTIREAGLRLISVLLKEAKRRGADLLVTACPLCQFNLECFQERVGSELGEPIELTVGFFTQILGLALGLGEERLGVQRMLRWDLPELAGVDGGNAHAYA